MTALTDAPSTAAPVHKRFLGALPGEFEAYIRAAQEYVANHEANKGSDATLYLYQKPFDTNPGNPTYFIYIYNVLNLLKALQLPRGRRCSRSGVGAAG